MSTIRPWAVWRRIQYGGAVGAMCMLGMVFIYFNYFYQPASCFDGRQSGDQTGVDCGGSCVRICAREVTPPIVEWSESFKIATDQYNAVAYVRNPNFVAGTPELRYAFRFYDTQGEFIKERRGQSVLPPNSTYALFEGRISLFNRELGRTEIVLEPAELWLPADIGREQFDNRDFELVGVDSRPNLFVTLENTSLTQVERVDVVATIFDNAGTPLTASETFIENFSPRSNERITFTWPAPIARTVRSCIVPSDIMMILDRSGSMAADGGDPPEPLESAKRAAQSFLNFVQPRDQVGYLSYATMPSSPIEQTLSNDFAQVQRSIAGTRMGTDGIQYTNMGAAFREAFRELQSARARDDARKVIVFLTDGDVTRPVNPVTGLRDVEYAAQYARDNAQAAKDREVTIYTIGFGDFFLEIEDILDRDLGLVRDLASDPGKSFIAPTVAELERVYRNIAEDICEEGPARIDIIPRTGANFAPLR